MNNIMKLADAYAEAKSDRDYMADQGTGREMREEFPAREALLSKSRAALEAAVAELQAKLSAMESVEPVAWMGHRNGIRHLTSQWQIAQAEPETYDTPLYTAPKVAQPLSELQINGMCADANRSHDIGLIDYTKAVRDAERAHNIGGQQP